MKGVVAVHPEHDEKDAHLVRRLGWAVVAQWGNLPPAVRERLREQAILVSEVENESVQLAQQLEAFLRKHARGV